ncbi:MAG: polysaccharide biosynthesis tyrosine autokinase [Crocosphaera sp.]|nr:polysaccharide biosynthesis tyrosine autokinase [Crocosphaera sp.]
MTETNFLPLLSILNRRKWLALTTFSAVLASAVAYLLLVPTEYKVKTKLMVNEQQTGISELGKDLQLSTYQTRQSDPLATLAELAESKRILTPALEEVFPQKMKSPEVISLRKTLTKKLDVKIVPSTNILELTYQYKDPEIASKVLNSITETLVAEKSKTIRSQAQVVREFLEAEIPKQRELTEAATSAENKYRQQHGLISVSEQTSNLVNSLENLENQQRELQSQLQNNRTKTQEFQRLVGLQDREKAYITGQIKQNQNLQTLQNKLVDLEIQLANARSRFTETHPTVLSLVEEQDKVLQLYQQALAKVSPASVNVDPNKITTDELSQTLITQFILNEIEGLALQQQLQALQPQIAQLQSRLVSIPRQQQPLARLVREKEEAVNNLKFLESKLVEARLAEAQLLSNIIILELSPADSSNTTPSKPAVLVFASFFGLIFATGMILLQETLDNTLYQDLDLEKWLGISVIADLPNLPEINLFADDKALFLHDQELVEPYRRLLKTLELDKGEKSQSIIVSSSISVEGKSVVAAHLGTVSAMLFRRTLIIDGNLHNPEQHQLFSIQSSPGLTDILDQGFSLGDLIQPTEIHNLYILPCGSLKSQGSLVLESPEMKSLLKEIKQHYDQIIIDTSSLDNYADAITLGELSDKMILVVQPKLTPKNILENITINLEKQGIKLRGLVVNHVKKRRKSNRKF